MAIEIIPTLELMASIYALSPEGGVESERFVAFRRASEKRQPLPGFNPMTKAPVVDVIDALIEIEAERLAHETANIAASAIGFAADESIHLTVASPGMWTDRFATEVEHRLKAENPTSVLLWDDESVTVDYVQQQVAAQVVRLQAISRRQGRPPATLIEAVEQEGSALGLAGYGGAFDTRAAEILEFHAGDDSLGTMVAFLYGDEGAEQMGYTPLGLDARTGYEHAISVHNLRLL